VEIHIEMVDVAQAIKSDEGIRDSLEAIALRRMVTERDAEIRKLQTQVQLLSERLDGNISSPENGLRGDPEGSDDLNRVSSPRH